jgi:hypothetical protein
MSRSAQCPNFAKERFSNIRSRSPRLPPTTAALKDLTPCARGGSKILPSLGIRRTASEYRIRTRGSSVHLFTRSFLKRSSIARGPAWRTGMPDKQPLRNMPQNGIFCLRFWGSLGRPRPTGVPRPRAKPPLHRAFFPTGTLIAADRGYNRSFSALWREAPCRTGESRRASKADTRVSARGHRANIPPTSRTGGPRCRTGGK